MTLAGILGSAFNAAQVEAWRNRLPSFIPELRESGDGFEGGYGEMKLEYPNCVFPGSGIGVICMFPAGSRLSSRGGSLQAVRLRFDPSDSFLVSLCLTPARRRPG